MKNASPIEYLKLAAILAIPMLFISAYSFSEGEWSFTLQKAEIAEYFAAAEEETQDTVANETQAAIAIAAAQDSIAEGNEAANDTVVNDTSSQRILFFGDSMLESLNRRLKYYASENNHELLNVIWYNSGTKVWGTYIDTLAHFMRDFQPTYIFICLGSNEQFIKKPDEHEAYVKQILEQIGDIPYVWIGPPSWKKNTGINDVIARTVAPTRFFHSTRLKFERLSDEIHPTTKSSAKWMDSVAVYVKDSINYRILMNYPKKGTKPKGTTIYLQPLETI